MQDARLASEGVMLRGDKRGRKPEVTGQGEVWLRMRKAGEACVSPGPSPEEPPR